MHKPGWASVTKISILCFRLILAVGIHLLSGGKPPMSHRVYALNSFVLPIHEVDVSYAPILGLCPDGIYST
jgi:hypothetical protein